MFRKIGLLSVLVVLLFSMVGVRVHADDTTSAISVSNFSIENHFRDRMIFRATISSTAGKIVAARVLVRTQASSITKAHPADTFTSDTSVDMQATWVTVQDVTPPWQILKYTWQVTDDAGNTFTSPVQITEMSDDTEPWQSLSDGKVKVYWYGEEDGFGQQLLDSARKGFDHVSKATGYTPDEELRVVMYPNNAGFYSFFPATEKIAIEWVGGQTFDSMTVQWDEGGMNGDGGRAYSLDQVVPHELAHAFLSYRLHGRQDIVPSWFNEGQAVNNQIAGVDEELNRAKDMAQSDRLIRLGSMNNHTNSTMDDIRDWYAEATSLVAFLYDKYGLEILGKIVDYMNAGHSLPDAIKYATGLSMTDYEIQWRAWVGAPELSANDLKPTATIAYSFPPTPTTEPMSH